MIVWYDQQHLRQSALAFTLCASVFTIQCCETIQVGHFALEESWQSTCDLCALVGLQADLRRYEAFANTLRQSRGMGSEFRFQDNPAAGGGGGGGTNGAAAPAAFGADNGDDDEDLYN